MKISNTQSPTLSKIFNDTDQCATTFTVPTGGGGGGTGTNTLTVISDRTYSPQQQCNCIPEFSPMSNLNHPQNYVLSFWIKETGYPSTGTYTNGKIDIQLNGTSLFSVTPPAISIEKSKIIDGWQKYDYYFSLPSNVTAGSTLNFTLENTSTSPLNYVYFDDIRIHPFNATMQSIVYDPLYLRLWATLDDRNYATFYEYDTEGTLVRTKKETETGIRTIQEKRHSLLKSAN